MISVIIPVFNCEKYLDKCINSVQQQTISDWELVLIDDGSTDGSLDIIKKYSEKDERIRFFHKDKSEGAGPARNKGIEESRGEFIMFIDADDHMVPDMFEKLCLQIKNGYDIVICGYQCYAEGIGNTDKFVLKPTVLKGNGEVRNFFARTFPDGMAGYLWNKIYRRDLIVKNNISFPAMKRLQDGVFNIRYFSAAESCCILDEALYFYRINPQTDMFKKCPPDYFDLIKSFSEEFISVKSLWGEYPNGKIFTFFLNETGTCVENCFGPNWNMSRSERKEYLKTLSQDVFLQTAIAENGSDVGRYRRFLLNNINNYAVLGAAVFIKTRMKIFFKKFFYDLKNRGKSVENK